MLVIVVVAFGLRVAVIFAAHTYHFLRSDSPYVTTPPEFLFGFESGSIAGSLASGKGFSSPFGWPTGPTAWIAPVYPTLVAGIFKVFGLYTTQAAILTLSLNSLFSALTCISILLIGRRTIGNIPALISAWLWAVLPIFMRWPTTWVWDMSLSALLFSTLFLLTLKLPEDDRYRSWVLYGVVWAISALTNPAVLSVFPFVLIWLAMKRYKAGETAGVRLLLAISVLLLLTSPWIIRNRVVLGKAVFLRDNFWFEFHLGNYHYSNGLGWGGKHPAQNQHELDMYTQLGELKYIEHYRGEAISFLHQYPREFLDLTMSRIAIFWRGDLFDYYPEYFRWERYGYIGLSILGVLGILLALANRRPGSMLFVIVVLFYPVVYYITYPGLRYRHAIEPFMLLMSAYFVVQVLTGKLFTSQLIARNPAPQEPQAVRAV